jgi:hypothetical protein
LAPLRIDHRARIANEMNEEGLYRWQQAKQCALHHRIPESRPRQCSAELTSLPLDRFLEVNHHDDTGLHRGAEQRDESHPNSYREVVAK